MTTEIPDIAVGTPDFAEPTLLLAGNADGFRRVASELRARREIIVGKRLPGPRYATLQILSIGSGSVLSNHGSDFSWQIAPSEADEVAHLVLSLVESQHPAHVYLDPTTNLTGMQIIASINEYDPARIF